MTDFAAGRDVTLFHARQVEWNRISTEPLYVQTGHLSGQPSKNAWTCSLPGHLVFPGLVNAHDHLQMNCIPPLPCHEPFPNSYAWIDAFQPHRASPAVCAARAIPYEVRYWHGALKNLLCGATTVAHHDPTHAVLEDTAFPVRTLRDFGWSHSLGLGLADSETPRFGPEVRSSFAATPGDQPWIIHLAEGTDPVAASELEQLEKLGCLAANTVLVHGVGLTTTDIERVLARGAGVIWCPGSNLQLLGRTLAPRPLLAAGRLALGSDSRLAGSFDLLEDLRLAARYGPCTPQELLRLTTAAGSSLLRLPDVGGLAVGQRADLLILKDTGMSPYDTLLAQRRADIRAVVRDGLPVIADPDFAEWFAVCGIETAAIRLDGRPKLCAQTLLGPPGTTALEAGVAIA